MANHGAQRYQRSQKNDTITDVKSSSHVQPAPLITGGLEFVSLTYTVVKKQKVAGKWTSKNFDLLNRITGYAPKGCVTAVMGPSGAGKLTFLDGLAGRITSGSLLGRVSPDGVEMSPSLIKRTSAYIMQDDRLFPMLTVYETLMFAADFRLGAISREDKRLRVEKLIEQLGLTPSRNTYIGDEGTVVVSFEINSVIYLLNRTRRISGGKRRRVLIGVDIIHSPALLFLGEPTSGLDSTSAHRVIERIQHIARAGSTVILTIHQPSYRIQALLDHLIILARGRLVYQGTPKDVTLHLSRLSRKVPEGENPIEHLMDVIQEYDQSELGVEPLAEFCLTGMRPPPVGDAELSVSAVGDLTAPHPPLEPPRKDGYRSIERLPLFTGGGGGIGEDGGRRIAHNEFDHSLRTPGKSSWSGSHQSGVMEILSFSPSRTRKTQKFTSTSPSNFTTTTTTTSKFSNSFLSET